MNPNGAGRVLVVDDDPRLVRLVREVLSAAGFQVLVEHSGERSIQTIALEQPDLVLLDIMLDDADGYSVARRAREFSDVPIVMLTAKVSEADLLAGFEAGADDYITKPFSSKVLLARVRAVLKRARASPSEISGAIVCGDLRLDLARRQVRLGECEIHLTATEYNLLYELASHLNQVVFHEDLLSSVWGVEYRGEIDYLRSYIHQLRRKLEPDPAHPTMIINIQGVGYMLSAAESMTAERDA
jgi:two-component system KDP operon response regulator KdpE